MSHAFTRAQIEAMSPEERVKRIDELNAWAAAGAVDGQAVAEAPKTFTRAELEAMSASEAAQHVDAINAQAAAGPIL